MKNVRDRLAAAVPTDGGSDVHGNTRDRVARSLLHNGASTASALAERLRLTPAAVRRHLDALLVAGMIEAREQRVYGTRGRGRPAKVFALTESGRDAFYQAYDDLAVRALRYLARSEGREAVRAFARDMVSDLAERADAALAAARPEDRTRVLADVLTAEGYAATATPASRGGEQLCQHHCPVAHVAEQFPELCEAETEVFAQLLGTHVQRLATIAHGDGVCTTHVPAPLTIDSPSTGRTSS